MPDRHEVFQITCPPSTPASAPLEIATPFPQGVVEQIEVHWPKGHASLTGIQIAYAHQAVVPDNMGAFILSTKPDRTFSVPRSYNSGAWAVMVYNTDLIAHYWQVVFDVLELPKQVEMTQLPMSRLPVSAIYSAAGGVRVLQ